MQTVPNWQFLQHMTRGVSRQSSSYSTTLYANQAQVDRWCETGQLRALVAEGAVLVTRYDRDFDRVYHVARDLPALTDALGQLPAGRYVADLVGRDKALDELRIAYAAGGFVDHAFLRRMGCAPTAARPPSSPSTDVLEAGYDETEEVAAFLNRLLDRFSEQLPTIDELRLAAREKRLLVVRKGPVLAGMLMYDLQGQLAHLRFWHVDPGAQDAGVGGSLMARFLSSCAQARRIILWVIGDNDRSIAIYRRYGFEVDGLLDHIMISDKD